MFLKYLVVGMCLLCNVSFAAKLPSKLFLKFTKKTPECRELFQTFDGASPREALEKTGKIRFVSLPRLVDMKAIIPVDIEFEVPSRAENKRQLFFVGKQIKAGILEMFETMRKSEKEAAMMRKVYDQTRSVFEIRNSESGAVLVVSSATDLSVDLMNDLPTEPFADAFDKVVENSPEDKERLLEIRNLLREDGIIMNIAAESMSPEIRLEFIKGNWKTFLDGEVTHMKVFSGDTIKVLDGFALRGAHGKKSGVMSIAVGGETVFDSSQMNQQVNQKEILPKRFKPVTQDIELYSEGDGLSVYVPEDKYTLKVPFLIQLD
ncbi:MAG: hypothetical protein AB7F43_02320 [Bacteriovoracia bacterium]